MLSLLLLVSSYGYLVILVNRLQLILIVLFYLRDNIIIIFDRY
jgi:hypothetical protein